MKILFSIILFFICYFSIAQKINPDYNQKDFNKAIKKYAKGPVPDISTKEVYDHPDEYILLDCRELKEYNVSHIENGMYVGFNKFNKAAIKDIPKNKKIVVYCTISWRSEKIGEKLMKWGYKEVYNLEGSILKWNNDNYPLYNNLGVVTDKIHTYDKTFSKYVKHGKVIYK